MKRFFVLLAAVCALGPAGLALAGTAAPAASTTAEPQVLRVGGDYTVSAIDKVDDRSFRVEFKAVKPTGKFDVLHLDSDHIHVAVKVGQTLRLSAEILAQHGSSADVAQMVLFLPSVQGHVPVWLLSNKAPVHDLRATKYLEMHVPMTDYMVM
jgi:hypothetical protein